MNAWSRSELGQADHDKGARYVVQQELPGSRSTSPFADQLTRSALGQLRDIGRIRPFTPRQILFLEGESAEDVYLVESGLVKVYVTSPDGVELILGVYGRGELLGEMAATGGGVRSASGMGHTSGRVLQVSGQRFRTFLGERPTVMAQVLEVVQQRLRRADRERLSYLSDDVPARVAHKLLSWAQRFGDVVQDGSIVITRFSRRELAQSVAAADQTVDGALLALSAAGLIATGRRKFVVLDAPRLHQWATDRDLR
jgi:CRP/FNR family cyclic AMP-dependent transcriptional regulator